MLDVEMGTSSHGGSSPPSPPVPFNQPARTTGGGGAPSLVRASSMMEPR